MEQSRTILFRLMGFLCMIAVIFTVSDFHASADYTEQTIIVSEDGQVVDSFCGVDAEYIFGYSDTGPYCCAGYVSKFYSQMFGVTVYNINIVDDKPSVYAWGKNCELREVKTPKPGDIMQDKDYSHVAIVKQCTNGEVTIIEQNYKWWWNYDMFTVVNRKLIQDKHYYYRLYIDGVEQTIDTKKPAISSLSTSAVTGSGYTVSAKLSDDKGVTSVKVATYAKSDKSDLKTVTYNKPSANFSCKIKTSDFKNLDANYVTTLYAYDSAGNCISKSIKTYVDTTVPTISAGKGSEITAKGYTFTVNVNDLSGVKKVEIPAWTAENSSDDKVYYYPTNDGNNYTIKVPTSDHSGDTGLYRMKVKVWDNYGNYTYKVYEVTINPAKAVKLNTDSVTLVESNSKTLSAEMVGENLTDKVSWNSEDKNIATVSKGKVTAVSAGKTKITATTTGGKSASCTVKVTTDISNAKITYSDVVKFTGKAACPEIKAVYNGVTLKNKTDYTVSYSQNNSVGTGKITVSGKGCYTGKVTKTFSIIPSDVSNITLTKTAATSLSFSWKASSGATGYVVYKYNNTKKKWTRYDEINSNSYTDLKLDNSTRYKYKLKPFKIVNNDYVYGKATAEFSFVTKPGRTTATASCKKAGTITFNWDWVPAVHGYEIWVSPNGKAGTYERVAVVKKTLGKEKYSCTVKGLESGKIKYVKVRAYRTVNEINLNGQCSKVLTIFVK